MRFAVFMAIVGAAPGFQFHPSGRAFHSPSAGIGGGCGGRHLSSRSRLVEMANPAGPEESGAPDDSAALDKGADDAALMASLRARIDQEGGPTAFKIKTDAKRVTETISDGADKALSGVKDVGSSISDRIGQSSSALDSNAAVLLGGLLAVSVGLALVTRL